MHMLKHAVTRHMKLHLLPIILHPLQHAPICHPGALQRRGQILKTVMPVWTSVRFPRSRGVLRKDLLAGERTIAPSPPIPITPYISVRMPDIIPILFIKRIIRHCTKPTAPVLQRVRQRQTQTLEEERILQTRVVLEVVCRRQCGAEGRHAEREVGDERGDRGRGYGPCCHGGRGGGGGGEEGGGEVGEDG